MNQQKTSNGTHSSYSTSGVNSLVAQTSVYPSSMHSASYISHKDFDILKETMSTSLPRDVTIPEKLTKLPQDTLDDIVHQAIKLHEKNELEKSTALFKTAADAGSTIGIYFYGLALRSGWGCRVDEKTAFKYISRAAELAVTETSNYKIATRELTLAVYELGLCFCNGWGVKRDKKTGAFYLQIAANLGDSDAQIDIATLYIRGEGVKKDKMKASKYFRLAENQGQVIMNNSWIWKSKYDMCGVAKKEKDR